MKKKFLVDKEKNEKMEMARKIFMANGAKDVNELIVSIEGKEGEKAISGNVSIDKRFTVLTEISAALKEGEKFFHTIKKGFLVIWFGKTKEEIAAIEKESSSRIFGETMRNLEIPCV